MSVPTICAASPVLKHEERPFDFTQTRRCGGVRLALQNQMHVECPVHEDGAFLVNRQVGSKHDIHGGVAEPGSVLSARASCAMASP